LVSANTIERNIEPPVRDLGDGFYVRRALPSVECRMVGPFVFFDQFGPASFAAGAGLDVRPHPHIGLATVTYLFEGEIVHRDSLGSAQTIRAGDVNWMVAGRGIAHSERTGVETRRQASSLAGIQSWVALPQDEEERPASFAHHAARDLPLIDGNGRRIRIIAGSLFGERAPVATFSAMGYADALLEPGAVLEFGGEHEQSAVYVVEGAIEVAGVRFGEARLLLPRAHERVTLRAIDKTRLMLLAGAPLDGPRYVWWNFVSSSRERIEQAKHDWRDGRFGAVPGDASEFIPLPPGALSEPAPRPAAEGEVL
jgi:redox-sensitive bicupin YhaK (pirin superfamily)